MKKPLIGVIIMMIVVIIMTTFHLSLGGNAGIELTGAARGTKLFVCPILTDDFWHRMAAGFAPFSQYITIGFFFCTILLLFVWGWALYQNLLKDEFKRENFTKPWQFTKLLFWAGIVVLLTLNTPNRYRRVEIDGVRGEWVLCENTSIGAKTVAASRVHNR